MDLKENFKEEAEVPPHSTELKLSDQEIEQLYILLANAKTAFSIVRQSNVLDETMNKQLELSMTQCNLVIARLERIVLPASNDQLH
jgi:hypothetical protein